MHTATMTQRFGVPALVAATFHVVLLFCLNFPVARQPIAAIGKTITTICEWPIEPVAAPPEDAVDESSAPVQSMSSGAAIPAAPEQFTATGPIAIAVDPTTPANVPVGLDKVPTTWTPGGTGTPGEIDTRRRPLFSPDQLDAHPRAKGQIPPEYPFAMRSAGVEGSVTVEFDVDASGRVTSARAVKSSAREFEEPAVRAVLKWRFESGKRHGKPVPFRMVVPIGFTMTDRD